MAGGGWTVGELEGVELRVVCEVRGNYQYVSKTEDDLEPLGDQLPL